MRAWTCCPFVIHALQWNDRLEGVYSLKCQACPRDHLCDSWGVPGVKYKHEGKDLLGKKWDKCPTSYLKDSRLNMAVELYAATKISPLQDWPDGWAAWVRDYLVKIDQAIKERNSFETER